MIVLRYVRTTQHRPIMEASRWLQHACQMQRYVGYVRFDKVLRGQRLFPENVGAWV